jgi:hypothetical protein
MALLPRRVEDAMSKAFKADKVLTEIDDRARLSYQQRATGGITSGSKPGLSDGSNEQ